MPALIGMEASGIREWFVEVVEDLGHVVWIGDANGPHLPGKNPGWLPRF